MEIPESFGLVVEENSSEASEVNNTVGRSWVKTVRMGLFQNQKLVAWMERCEKPESWDAEEGGRCFRLDPQEVELEEGDTLCFAAQVTDQYGRSFMVVLPGSACGGWGVEHRRFLLLRPGGLGLYPLN